MSAALRFRHAYASAFGDHLLDGGEETLRAAYELGREAVAGELSVLDLAAAHHEVVAESLDGMTAAEARRVVEIAGGFFAESLSAYEMVRRGYREAQEAAAAARRQAQTIRRLSTFLADASLASDTAGTLGEVLRLIAEEARELVDATGCIVAVRSSTGPPWTSASSPDELIGRLDLEREGQFLAVHALLEAESGPVLLLAEELEDHPRIAQLPEALRGWLGAPLRALDGRLMGWIQVFDWEDGGPTEVDEALIVHLAQMAAASLERTRLYAG
jgi:GAF domain-containing protein